LNLFKSFSLYTIASFVERGIAFFLLPIFTFYLTTKDFGLLALITSIFSFTLPLVTLGIQGAISVAFFNGKKENYPSYFTSSIFPPFLISIFLTIIILIFKKTIENYLEISIVWILIIPFFCFLSFFNSLLLIDYQIKDESKKYVVFSLTSSSFNVLVSILLVVFFKYGFEGRLLGQYLSLFIYSLVAFYILYFKRKLLIKSFSWINAKDSLLYGLPLVPHIVGGMVINMSDRFFIDYFYGKEQLGIYNIGYILGSILSILSGAFANAIIPFSYKLFAENTYDAKAKVVKVYWIFVALMAFSGIVICLLTPLIFKWFVDIKFSEGSKYVVWIVLGYFFQGMYLLFANIIFYLKKTTILFYFSFINILINLSLNYFLIPKFGPMGAAYATFISFLVFFIMIAIYCNKMYPLPWRSTFFKHKIDKI
jgi:O-antigen/teichoic acid export membrane protein